MSKATDNLLEQIEDLRDHIHNLKLDLRSSQELRRQAEESLVSVKSENDGLKSEIQSLQNMISSLEDEVCEEETEKLKAISLFQKEQADIQKKRENYKKSLYMIETLRQGNVDYFFHTHEGAEYMKWAQRELESLVGGR